MPDEQQLSHVLSEFARTLVTDFPIQGILDHLVQRIVDVLPITAAGVTLISPGMDPRYVAASDESALRFEQLQTELGEGPCVAAYRTGEAIALLESAVKDDPTNIVAHYRLSGLYRRAGRTTDSQHEMDAFHHYQDLKDKLGKVFKQVAGQTSRM